jgi:hypothetical protein
MLEYAGWSEWARNDIEIFKLVDTDGLTPLLMVLNNATDDSADNRATPSNGGAAARKTVDNGGTNVQDGPEEPQDT